MPTKVWRSPKNQAQELADAFIEEIDPKTTDDITLSRLCVAPFRLELGEDPTPVERTVNSFLNRFCNYYHGSLRLPSENESD